MDSVKPKKEHICARMVRYLTDRHIVVGQWEADHKISNGYLRRSAKDGTNIGFDLIENFLESFPEVDIKWLITGAELSTNTEGNHEKGTAATNNDEAAVKESLKELSSSIKALTQANLVNAQTISQLLDREVVKEG